MTTIQQSFNTLFHSEPRVNVSAPGRANLIGEHTDYNNGFVLPFPLPHKVSMCLGINEDGPKGKDAIITLGSELYPDDTVVRKLSESRQDNWTDYVIGSIIAIAENKGLQVPSLNISVKSTVPTGAGVSSSAALEVVTMRAIKALLGLDISDVEIAILARKAENEYVGMPCGIMDQFASSVGISGHALLIDCQSLKYENVKLDQHYDWLVMKSGVSHQLVDGEYEKRVNQCASACKLLNVSSLRELHMSDLPRIEKLPELERKRARHVVSENDRVLKAVQALKDDDMKTLSALLLESHASQRDDYEITVPETDLMVVNAVKFGALTARQTGGGFGGSLIIILEKGKRDEWWSKMQQEHPHAELI